MNELNEPPELPETSTFQFKEDQQLKLYELLGRLIGEGAAQLFRDACYLIGLDDQFLPSHKTYLVGHLLRELEGSIFDVIKPLAEEHLV